MRILFALLFVSAAAFGQPGTISTSAGGYPDGLPGPASQAFLTNPGRMAHDAAGNIYIMGQTMIYKMTPDRRISVFAGSSIGGFGGDGGAASQARLNLAGGGGSDILVDSAGNIIFSDTGNNRIRQISPGGIINTIAGTGPNASGGDGGLATASQLASPLGLAQDASGVLYVAEANGNRVRRIAVDGKITTVAGDGTPGYRGDGGPASQAWLNVPYALALDSSSNLYILDHFNNVVRRVTPGGIIDTFSSSAQPGNPPGANWNYAGGIVVDSSDNLYIAASGRVLKQDKTGRLAVILNSVPGSISDDYRGPATTVPYGGPDSMMFDAASNLWLSWRNTVFRIGVMDTSGIVSSIAGVSSTAGSTGPPAFGRVVLPQGLAFDPSGALNFVEQAAFRVRKVLMSGISNVPATLNGSGLAIDAQGDVFTVNDTSDTVIKTDPRGRIVTYGGSPTPYGKDGSIGGDGGLATQAYLLNPNGLAADKDGSLYIADRGNHRIRKVTPEGIINTFAGSGTQGFGGDGDAATAAQLNFPNSVAIDSQGSVFIADGGNNRIRKVTSDGKISTYAGNGQGGFAGDGGPAIQARVQNPRWLAVDLAGNLFITESTLRVRKVSVNGSISTVAGNGSVGFSGDGGPAINATFNNLQSIAVDVNGNIYVSDTGNSRIRVIQGSAPFRVQPSSLVFPTTLNAPASTQALNLATSDGSPRKYQITASVPWLTASPASGTVTSQADARVLVTANPAELKKGTYPGSLTILDLDAGSAVQVPITLTVSGTAQQLRLSQVGATFTALQNGNDPSATSIQVLNTGTGSMPWTASVTTLAGGPWLAVTRNTGTSTAGSPAPSFVLTASAGGLPPGPYYARVDVSAPSSDNSPQSAVVLLNVLPADGSAGPQVNPAGLLYTADANAASVPAQQVELANVTTRTINYTASVRYANGSGWLTTPANGSLTAGQRRSIDIAPRAATLSSAVYRATVTFNFTPENVARTLDIALVVNSGGPAAGNSIGRSAGCVAKTLVAVIKRPGSSYQTAAGWPVPIEASVIDDCRNPLAQGQVTASFSNNDPALALLSLGDGTWQGTWASRTTTANVTVTVRAASADATLSGQTTAGVRSDLNPNQPSIAPGGVLNAASFRGDTPVSPGGYISVFGARLAKEFQAATSVPLPPILGDTVVAIGGKSAPLHFASDGQVNAILPYGIPDSTTLQMIVRRGTTVSLPEPVLIGATQPAVFAYDGSGKGQGHIYVGTADGLFLADNAHPAKAGDALVFYATGLGPVSPSAVEGQAPPTDPISAPINPIEVTIQGKKARLVFAGLVYAGVFQINVYVPDGVTPDPAAALTISAGRQPSPIVTLAITQ